MKKMAMVLAVLLVFCGIAFADYPYGGFCPNGPGGKVGGYVYSKCSETENKPPCDSWMDSDGGYFVDTWKFAQCNCTSYAAYMLNFYGITFNNSYLGGEWHDGESWGGAASGVGIKVDKNPIPGDIAYWGNGDYGHVAWVEKVSYDDGKATEVKISEYNFDITHGFGDRTISADNPTGYIHILAYNEAVAETYYLDCYEMDKLCTTQTKEEWSMILKKVWSDYRCKENCNSKYSTAYIDTLSKAIGGMGGGPGTENLPIEPQTPSLPDFKIKKLWLETYWGYETYTYGTSESIKIRTLTENVGEAKPESDVEMR